MKTMYNDKYLSSVDSFLLYNVGYYDELVDCDNINSDNRFQT